jgi:hypothetical protein
MQLTPFKHEKNNYPEIMRSTESFRLRRAVGVAWSNDANREVVMQFALANFKIEMGSLHSVSKDSTLINFL